MKKGIADSQILMHYDNGHLSAIDWWETRLEDGWVINISLITCMERLKGDSGLQYNRQLVLQEFQSRIQLMLKERKYAIFAHYSRYFQTGMQPYRAILLKAYPPPKRNRMESLICDMFIAATALKHRYVLFTQNLSDFQWITSLNIEKADYD